MPLTLLALVVECRRRPGPPVPPAVSAAHRWASALLALHGAHSM